MHVCRHRQVYVIEYYMCVDIYRNIDKFFTHLVNSVNWSNKQPPLVPKYNYEATKSELLVS